MKLKATVLLMMPILGITIVVSLFLGLMCASLGAAFPPLMAIGGQVVCDGGEFGIDSQSYSLPNGQRGTTRSPYCIDEQGEKKGVTFPLVVVDTLIYATIIFVLLLIPLVILLVIVVPRLKTPKARE